MPFSKCQFYKTEILPSPSVKTNASPKYSGDKDDIIKTMQQLYLLKNATSNDNTRLSHMVGSYFNWMQYISKQTYFSTVLTYY